MDSSPGSHRRDATRRGGPLQVGGLATAMAPRRDGPSVNDCGQSRDPIEVTSNRPIGSLQVLPGPKSDPSLFARSLRRWRRVFTSPVPSATASRAQPRAGVVLRLRPFGIGGLGGLLALGRRPEDGGRRAADRVIGASSTRPFRRATLARVAREWRGEFIGVRYLSGRRCQVRKRRCDAPSSSR
jgi:hypothetical protein